MASAPSADAPPYAVDFEVVACGKAIPNSKRRIRFRFGFASPSALSSGKTGVAARGDEHEVTLVWSVYSGKSVILMDGKELKYDKNTLEGTEYSWQCEGRILRVTAQGRTLTSNNWLNPSLRQYDFFVDGVSYFSFPPVGQLGRCASGGAAHASAAPSRGMGAKQKSVILAPRTLSEEDANLRRAIEQSIAYESRRQLGQNPPQAPPPARPAMSTQASQLFIDFFDDFEATGNTHPPLQPQPDDPWAFVTNVGAPPPPTNPFATPAPAQAAPATDFFSAPAQAPPPAGAPPQPPAADDPFGVFGSNPSYSPSQQGAMVMGNNQGGNWGLQGQGQPQQPPPYTMTGGYGQGAQQQQQQHQNQWGAPPS
eukprot:CAMPEP_0172527700 /NCGR_PEP_ID=MMETSP1067-20121228/2324_1 /TAXON_ID=265564 ORGANISM="Thalassiosira punctigera, Strain Tpunct2005C2" /NCGR_SAMPLE_ID=MMETSP1067 /ASSEMBLY_ACC=CAM_ASM_000444 /LENGTH=366 /DNA_ID=CAMNT_0013311493 /DNA_START=37 /DNA_END=1137 /DNA_ORIENTATION=+